MNRSYADVIHVFICDISVKYARPLKAVIITHISCETVITRQVLASTLLKDKRGGSSTHCTAAGMLNTHLELDAACCRPGGRVFTALETDSSHSCVMSIHRVRPHSTGHGKSLQAG